MTVLTDNPTSAGQLAVTFCTEPAVSCSAISSLDISSLAISSLASSDSGHRCDDNCLYCWGPETD